MDYAHPRYFDYFEDYGDILGAQLEYSGLAAKVAIWRKNGLEDPDSAATGCRKVLEHVLDRLINDTDLTRGAKLIDKIDLAKRKRLISGSFVKKFHMIRKMGNRGAHACIDTVSASKSLVLLDEVLRKYVHDQIDPQVIPDIAIYDDTPFVVRGLDEVASLASRSESAAILSGDATLQDRPGLVAKTATEENSRIDRQVSQMELVLDQVFESGQDNALEDSTLDQLERANSEAAKRAKRADKAISQVEDSVDEILSEHDFIQKLLRGSGFATKQQADVLAFPKTENAATSILLINGAAGTGKTLCLLAKLIRETETENQGRQEGLFADSYQKKALFLCFNKALARHVQDLLEPFDGASDRIQVRSFDRFVNSMVKPQRQSGGYQAASDVRYPGGWRIEYGIDRFVKQAMAEVAKSIQAEQSLNTRGLEQYLESAREENVAWMKDEIVWLESRFMDLGAAKAKYPLAARIGRGMERRPGEHARQVVLRVYERYLALLEKGQRYTIGQAIKRLMTSQSLPRFDTIAIDEVQDFSVLSLKFVRKLLRGDRSRMYLSGDENQKIYKRYSTWKEIDENQKIYKRDFTWKEIDENLKGRTFTLEGCKRCAPSIYAFAARLLKEQTGHDLASRDVSVARAGEKEILARFKKLGAEPGKTTALIAGWEWFDKAAAAGIALNNPIVYGNYGKEIKNEGSVMAPGCYVVPEFKNKGLEFDNVIVVDYDMGLGDDEQEKNLRYVHYTRARQRLEIYYETRPSSILRTYYADFI